jgi:hypothetical protein
MNMPVEAASILPVLRLGISAANAAISKAASMPLSSAIALARSTMAPFIVLLLASTKENGMPVVVMPIFIVAAAPTPEVIAIERLSRPIARIRFSIVVSDVG